MNREYTEPEKKEIRAALDTIYRLVDGIGVKLETQPDLPDNTLPNAPVILTEASGEKVNDYYFPEELKRFYDRIEIDRNHGEDNHWLPWDGKDELPPYVKPDDIMTVRYDRQSIVMPFVTKRAKDIYWPDVIQYLWLERDSDE